MKAIDLGLWNNPSEEQLIRHAAELDRIEQDLARLEIPEAHAEQLYNLRAHVNLVRRNLDEAMKRLSADPPGNLPTGGLRGRP